MWKKLLLGLALSMVLDLLLQFGAKMEERAVSYDARNRWKIFQQIIILIKSDPKILTHERDTIE